MICRKLDVGNCTLRGWMFSLALFFAYSCYSQVTNLKIQPGQLFEMGEKAVQNKAYKTALAHFNECLRLDPYFWDAYHSRGSTKEKLGDPKGALTDYNIFLESKPENMEVLFTRAVLRYNYGQWAASKEDFIKMLKSTGGETNTVFFQADQAGVANKVMTIQSGMKASYLNYLGLIDWRMKSYKQAIAYLDSAIKVNGKEADYWMNRGIVKQYSRDTLGAIQDYKQALQLNVDHELAAHNLAVLSGYQGNQKEAERLLSETIEKNPTIPYPYEERGYIRMKAKNWKGALADFNMAISLAPGEPDNWLNRGITKEKLKNMEGAMADYTQAIIFKSDYERAWLNRGNLLAELNRLKEAIEDYTVAITHYPDYGLAFYNRALAYHKLGQLKQACADLSRAQKLEIRIDKKVMDTICK